MSTPSSQVGDVGTALRISIVDQDGAVVAVTSSTARTITLQRPNGTTATYAATVYDGPGGVIEYVTQAGDIVDQPGDWLIQGHVTFADGSWYTTTGPYNVRGNL